MKIARVNVESGPGLRAAPKGDQPLRIAMVYREAFLLTYVWHLTAFFERVCPTGLLVWEYWSYADLAQWSAKRGGHFCAIDVSSDWHWTIAVRA